MHFQPHNHSLAGRRPSLHMHRHHVVANIQSASLCHSLSFNCWGCLPSLTDYSAESLGQIMMFTQLVVLLFLSWAGSPSLAGRLCIVVHAIVKKSLKSARVSICIIMNE